MAVEFRLGGLEVGMASETQAVVKYGWGLRVEQPDGASTHIYEDPKAYASLFIQVAPDGTLQEMQLVEGLSRPWSATLKAKMSLAGLKTGAGVGLGASRQRVIDTYGPPHEQARIGALQWLTYKSDFSKDRRVRLSYQLSFGFQGARLARILLHNGN